jgi:hypothetical protein
LLWCSVCVRYRQAPKNAKIGRPSKHRRQERAVRDDITRRAQPKNQDPGEGEQTKRILGIIPNFRAVSVDTHLPPQTPKEKFVGFTKDSFDYSSFIWIGALAGVSQHSTPEFRRGAAGFGRYYWHSFADQADENLWVEFLLPVATRQDPRYYTLGRRTANGHNGPRKRAGYAVSRLFITRTDSGENTFNVSEVGGAGAAAAISNLYYPSPERTWTKTYQRWLLNASLDGTTVVFREFWPDINHAIFHGKEVSGPKSASRTPGPFGATFPDRLK